MGYSGLVLVVLLTATQPSPLTPAPSQISVASTCSTNAILTGVVCTDSKPVESGNSTGPVTESNDESGAESGPDTCSVQLVGTSVSCGVGVGAGGGPSTSLPTVVTVSDVASVTPASASINMEPSGWALLGSPTNFWVTATSHTAGIVLLGSPVTITFVPVGVAWDYGDGTTKNSTTLGASWARLGLPSPSDTDTSHRYSAKGTVTVTATVLYTATATLSNGQVLNINGTIRGTPATTGFRVYEQRSYLVPNP